MAKIKLNGDTSGYIEISAPAVSGNNTLELGPGTKILTNLDNTFTGVSTFSGDVNITSGNLALASATPMVVASNGSGHLRLGAGGSEKVRITSAGSVGIGTDNPGANLTVWADDGVTDRDVFQVRSKTGAFNIQVSDSDAANPEWSLRTYANEPIVFKQATTERLRISSTGQIGMGKAGQVAPNGNSPLTIQESDSNSETICLRATNSGGNGSQPGIVMKTAAGGHIGGIYCDVNSDYMRIATSGTDRIYISDTGNVGVGVASPSQKFMVKGIIASEATNSTNNWMAYTYTDNTFRLNYNGAGDDEVTVTSAGVVNIGDSSPNANGSGALNVYSSTSGALSQFVHSAGNGGLRLGGTGSGSAANLVFSNNYNSNSWTDEWTIQMHGSDDSLRFLTGGVSGTERIRITNVGRLGIDSAGPISKLQVGSHTFNGGNGMHSDDRVGMSNHGNLTGLMLASTYNDGSHPEYGLVFVQGPNTSSYNVWGLCPDGPAKGNSLNFHYDDQASNIHSPGFRKFQMTGDGYFLQPHQPKFRVGRNSSYSPGAGSDIIFNVDSGGGKHNVGLHYNTANGRFTAPVAGVYTFTAHVIWEGLSNGQNMADCFHPKINGVVVGYSGRRGEYIANETGNSGYYTDFMTYQFTLAAGDYVTINNQYSRTIHGNSNYTTFSGHLVG